MLLNRKFFLLLFVYTFVFRNLFHLFSANISKKGYLLYQENAAQDLWVKRWFVIRRPYIFIYTNETESDEQGVINVGSVRIDYNEALEKMIQVSFNLYMYVLILFILFFFFQLLASKCVCSLYQ